jgi:uncharacterized protein YjbI with pentapeptide repeats
MKRVLWILTMVSWVCVGLAVAADLEDARNEALEKCNGPFEEKMLTQEEIKEVLEKHLEWRKDYLHQEAQDSRRANLCKAKLNNANLHGANLADANLSEADLIGANLSKANLDRADLSGAKLFRADLSEARLTRAKLFTADLDSADLSEAELFRADLSDATLFQATLTEAHLHKAVLSGASLRLANLTRADLRSANLRGTDLEKADLTGASLAFTDLSESLLTDTDLSDAYLYSTDLSGARLIRTNLSCAVFEPASVPDKGYLSAIEGLTSVRFTVGNHAGLVLLRNALRDAGLRELEREATFALEHGKLLHQLEDGDEFGSRLESYFKLIFFELPVEWGLRPGRALWLLLYLIPLFAIPYILALSFAGKDGIWQDWEEKRARKDLGQDEPKRLTVGWRKAIGFGFYFSVLSAFSIGWREFNVGNWIARIQLREYTLRATGWVRTVAGVQSLISVYLVAMWVLTYFGRPFG